MKEIKKRREKWKFNSRIIKSLGKLCKSNSQIFIKRRNFRDKKICTRSTS